MYFLYAFIFVLSCVLVRLVLVLASSVMAKRLTNYAGPIWVERCVCFLAMSNTRTSRIVDSRINEVIDQDGFESSRPYMAHFAGEDVWISNWPYGYGSIGYEKELPSMRTRIRLRRYLMGKGVVHG